MQSKRQRLEDFKVKPIKYHPIVQISGLFQNDNLVFALLGEESPIGVCTCPKFILLGLNDEEGINKVYKHFQQVVHNAEIKLIPKKVLRDFFGSFYKSWPNISWGLGLPINGLETMLQLNETMEMLFCSFCYKIECEHQADRLKFKCYFKRWTFGSI